MHDLLVFVCLLTPIQCWSFLTSGACAFLARILRRRVQYLTSFSCMVVVFATITGVSAHFATSGEHAAAVAVVAMIFGNCPPTSSLPTEEMTTDAVVSQCTMLHTTSCSHSCLSTLQKSSHSSIAPRVSPFFSSLCAAAPHSMPLSTPLDWTPWPGSFTSSTA